MIKTKYLPVIYILTIVPGLIFLTSEVLSNIKGPGLLVIYIVSLVGLPSVFLGLTVSFFMKGALTTQIFRTISLIGFQLWILQLKEIIQDYKLDNYLSKNGEKLQLVCSNRLSSRWSAETASDYLNEQGLELKVLDVIKEEGVVLFVLSGLADNCYGIAFSLSPKTPKYNSCGRLLDWEEIRKNWFVWSTI
jgi:hypothetical protein